MTNMPIPSGGERRCRMLLVAVLCHAMVSPSMAFQPWQPLGALATDLRKLATQRCMSSDADDVAADKSNSHLKEIPLLDLLDYKPEQKQDGDIMMEDAIMIPLPSSHLPDEISTPFLYGMKVELPVHKLLMEEAISQIQLTTDDNAGSIGSGGLSGMDGPRRMYGHLVWKDTTRDSYVGAIGCTAEILVNAPSKQMFNPEDMPSLPTLEEDEQQPASNTMLCRGGYRFIVREVVRTIPYPIVKVEEIHDDDDEEELLLPSSPAADDNDDEDDVYKELSTSELMHRTMQNLHAWIRQRTDEAATKKSQMSPLEMSILEESGVSFNPAEIELLQAEEMAAVLDVFQTCIIDLEISLQQRPYAIAMLAAEMADVDNAIRKEILLIRNPKERLQLVCKLLEENIGMARATRMALQITDSNDESSKDLKVGKPSLPAWAKSLKKGTRVEYFWSEQDGWFAGVLVEDPELIVDEMIVTVLFDDGETHRLPLSPDEKVRWRPG